MSRPRVGRELQAIRRAKIWAAMSCKCLECCRRTKRRGEGKDGLVEGGTRKAEDKKERGGGGRQRAVSQLSHVQIDQMSNVASGPAPAHASSQLQLQPLN